MISVIIAVYKRQKKLIECISSILKNLYNNFEIIIIDQTKNDCLNKIKQFKTNKIKYFHRPGKGKAYALNFGIKHALGNILAFTDDDCLVNVNWLENINKAFKKDRDVVGVFGRTLPYNAKENKGKICPATFFKKSKVYCTSPVIHYKELGLGNNMSFKKEVLSKFGYFKYWLGVGSISMAGGIESELIYRILSKGFKLAFDPKIVVYHNRWITYSQEQILQGKYSCGLIAFYTFYLRKDFSLMKHFINVKFKERVSSKLNTLIKLLLTLKIRKLYYSRHEPLYLIWDSFCFIKGAIIGVYFSLKES